MIQRLFLACLVAGSPITMAEKLPEGLEEQVESTIIDPIARLQEVIPGSPGEDYPIFSSPPETTFSCDGFSRGYYADPEADCQSFHICAEDGQGGLNKYSFLCPNGTLFQQQYFICDWWFNVDCSLAEDFYGRNDEVAAAAAAANEGRGSASNNVESTLGGPGGLE